ncbi:hypothetical protein BGZ73_005665 [Actinomortierella ambigua]|nr:hypothetical protein BGZ73_005665 [Actinomortierella ambigua]
MSLNDPNLDDDGAAYTTDDDFEFDFDAPREVDPHQQWRDKITSAYLEARKVDQRFWRALQLGKTCRTTAIHEPSRSTPSLIPPDLTGPQQRWFLAMEHMRADDPYFAFDTLKDHGYPQSPEESPEEFSAHFPSRHHRTASGDRPGQVIKNTFQLIANFQAVTTGLCTLYLRVKKAVEQDTAARFLVRILVRYVHTGMSDIYYTRFVKTVDDKCTDWHYLEAEDQFEVRSHEGIAQVNIRIVQDDNYIKSQCGQLWIRSLVLVPFGKTMSPYPCRVVRPPTCPDFSLSTLASPDNVPVNGGNQEPEDGVVTRLVSSKNGRFLAALIVFSGHVKVKVWRTSDVEGEDTSKPKIQDIAHCGESAEIMFPEAMDIPLELAISASGEHIAVYQAPKVGDWLPKKDVPKSNFGVGLFRNFSALDTPPQVHIPVEGSTSSLADLAVDTPAYLENMVPVRGPGEEKTTQLLDHMADIPSTINNSVGYATFVDKITSGALSLPARFVFCDGLYLEVFELQANKLIPSNSIPLVNMSPSILWRTDACELMIRSIASNMFLWVEENGRYCSTWDLSNGSAIGRIEITGLQVGGHSGDTELRVACSDNIIAIVGYDNSITTVEASSGMTISRRLFSGRTVESIVFPSPQSHFLLVLLRGDDECEQSAMILDPLRLDVQGQLRYVPPISRLTVFANFGQKIWPQLGVVCRLDGQHLRFYNCKMPEPPTGKRNSNVDNPPMTCQYKLVHKEPFMRRGQETCQRQIEIWKKADPKNQSVHDTCVFSFIPEPWELHKPAKGMILPTGDRFVVFASWTVQLWSLPTPSEPRCRLIFYWSCPNGYTGHGETFGKSATDVVLESYCRFDAVNCRQITGDGDRARFQASIVFPAIQTPVDQYSDFPDAEQYEQSNSRKVSGIRLVPIPECPLPLADSLSVTLQCVKSVLLLALTHTIVSVGNQDFLPIVQNGSYEDHASAIIDFVNAHINHTVELSNSVEEEDAIKFGMTVMTQLLEVPRIATLSAQFITSLLENEDCQWIPRSEAETALIKAIGQRNNVAVRAILAYCAKKAATSHPTYIMPVEHSFRDLSRIYPQLLKDFFRQASYIPAQQVDFNETYVTASTFEWAIVGRRLLAALGVWPEPTLEDYHEPIITFQLRERSRHEIEHRAVTFQRGIRPKAIQLPYDSRIYAVPFPSLLVLGPQSNFHLLAGENYFDSPTQLAILNYKWWQYGLIYWTVRYLFLLSFYGIFMAMTFTEMHNSELVETPDEMASLFLGDVWFRLIVVDIVLGCALLSFEFIQYWQEGASRYFWTDGDIPQQFGFTTYAIVAMYLHLAGRYDAVGADFDSKRFDFLLLMVLFYFLCSIVLLTVLIAQVSDAFTDATKDGERAWRRQLSETLSEAEMVGKFLLFLGKKVPLLSVLAGFLRRRTSFWRRRSRPFPNIIYYMARIQEAEEYKEELKDTKQD